MHDLLSDIKHLFSSGDKDDALELLDLYLEAHPADAEALFLKIDLCLDTRREHAFIGQRLPELPSSPRRDELAQRRDALIRELLKDGRDQLRGRSPATALDRFEKAVMLAPQEAYVPLAAGLSLLHPPRVDNPFGSTLPSLLSRLPTANLTTNVEKYLRDALAKATSDSDRERASYHLVKHWLNQNKITQEALSLLIGVGELRPRVRALSAELIARVIALTLNAVEAFARSEDNATAERILKVCLRVKLRDPRCAVLLGEVAAGDFAAKHFNDALKWAKKPRAPISLSDAKTLLLAQDVALRCPHCGKPAPITVEACAVCGMTLTTRPLLGDRYALNADDTLIAARLGLAEASEAAGDFAAAHAHVKAALELLPLDHGANAQLRALATRLETGAPPVPDQPALKAFDGYAREGLNAETLLQVSRVNERSPSDWTTVEVARRSQLIRALIAGGHLKLAAETIDAAFSDKPRQIGTLRAALARQINAEIAALRRDTTLSPEALIAAATRLLELRADPDLLYARGMARLATEHDLLALDDFYAVIQAGVDEALTTRARKQAVGVLERCWNIEGARMLLDQLDDADAAIMRARLDRRERGEPVMHLEEAREVVMEDTLTRKPTTPYYHGYFAVAVREIGFPGNVDSGWYQRLMNAHYEFVQVIGALRDVMGDAIFVLRLISNPHPLIPERGAMTVALLARVSAGTPDVCRAHALRLWTDMHAILPLAQENIYVFEPVVDEDELRRLLTPFEYAHAAEIARRETDANEAKFIAPFTPGTFDIHNLHWVFLRQSQPAMISIHLKPTNLLPWEKLTTAQALTRATNAGDEVGAQPVTPEGFKLVSRVQLWEELRQTHAHNNYLKYAYLLRVYIAGSAGTSQLLPEMAAAALFGPLRDAGQVGGYEIMRAASPDEVAVTRRNLSRLDVEAPPGQARMRYLVAETEAANVFRLPVPQADGIPGMIKLEGRPVVPPAGMPESGARLGVSAARVKGVPMPIMQGLDDRRRHMYVVGKTGMGKSTLLMTLILQDIDAGRGVFLLDPHGDLCEDVLARIPAYRADDVIVLDPSEEQRPIGINILESESEADKYRIVNEFIAMLMRLYDPHNQAIVGPIFQQTVRNAMLAAMSMPDGTLVDVYRILSDDQYIKRVLPYIKDPLVKAYYEDIVKKMNDARDHWKAELLPYLLSKFSRFVEDGTLRRMIGQPRTSVPWHKVIEEQKILLVNLAKGRIGQDNASFIGGLVLSGMLQAAFKRGELPANKRRDFFMYIDEVQNFSTPMLATMLSEGRKFGVTLTIANQFLHQLDHTILEAVFGNVGSMVAFRVGTQDAPILAPEYYPSFGMGDLINLPQFTAAVKLMVDGVAARPFTMKTLPPMRPPDRARAELIRATSGRRYGADIATVQQEIMRKF